MDGAFLVVPNEMEKLVGFDHGPLPPHAEMTTFALRCRDRGAQFAWLDAPVDVPSPASLSELSALRRQSIAARLAASSVGGEGTPGALSFDRRAALLMLTGAPVAPHPTAQAHASPAHAVSSSCAHLCLLVTLLSVGIVHELVVSELLLNFFISCCSGVILFTHVLGLASSASPQSLGPGLDGWLLALALHLVQLALAPLASAAEVVFFLRALWTHLSRAE